MIARRDLLLGTVAAAAPLHVLATARESGANEAIGSIQLTTVEQEVPKLELVAPKLLVDGSNGFTALKDDLVKIDYVPKTFLTSFEDGALEGLQKALEQETAKKRHNPRLVEPLLGEISSLLERCLQYRDQGSAIELEGVGSAAARAVFEVTREYDLEILRNDKSKDASAIVATNYPAAAEQFEAKKDRGNATLAATQAAASGVVRDGAANINALSIERLVFNQQITSQLLARQDAQGNAHNFGERFDRLRQLYNADIEAAYRRALAAFEGLEKMFSFAEIAADHSFEHEIPKLKGNGFLDELVIWTRNAMRSVAYVAQTEIEFEKLIVTKITKGPMTLVIHQKDFDGLRNVRLRGIAAGFRANPNIPASVPIADTSFGFVMVKSSNIFGPPTVIVLPQVRKYSVAQDALYNESSAIYNVDPVGEWTVRLSTHGLGTDYYEGGFDRSDHATHIMLKLRIVASLNPENLNESWWTSEDRV